MEQSFDDFVRCWREQYRWPLTDTRNASERRIIQIEDLMRNRLLRGDPEYIKEDLSEIIFWKAGNRYQSVMLRRFEGNSREFVMKTILRAISILSGDADDVAGAVNALIKMKGVGIPVASAFLRFMDPDNHRYGVIDRNVALYLNRRNITGFDLRQGDYWIRKYPASSCRTNVREYQRYHHWLRHNALDLRRRNVTYVDMNGMPQVFSPVDIDMAIFAHMTQTRDKC